MKIVIPISHSDGKKPTQLVDLMLAFGGLKDHSVLVLHTPTAAVEAATAADRLKSSVRQINLVSTDEELVYGMPHNANIMFYKAIMALHKLQNKEPWLWHEPDSLPADFGAYNTIERGYKQAGRLFFGCIVPVPKVATEELAFRPTKEQIRTSAEFLTYTPGDEMMMGVGVYPANIGDIASLRALIMDLGKKPNRNPIEPFDVYLRGELRRAGWEHTDLIADMWNTCKYEDGPHGISAKPNIAGKTRIARDREGFLSPEAVLVHGCKDDSLYHILMKKAGAESHLAGEANGPEDIGLPALNSLQAQFAEKVEGNLKSGTTRLNNLAIVMMRQKDLASFTKDLKEAGFVIGERGVVRRGARKIAVAA